MDSFWFLKTKKGLKQAEKRGKKEQRRNRAGLARLPRKVLRSYWKRLLKKKNPMAFFSLFFPRSDLKEFLALEKGDRKRFRRELFEMLGTFREFEKLLRDRFSRPKDFCGLLSEDILIGTPSAFFGSLRLREICQRRCEPGMGGNMGCVFLGFSSWCLVWFACLLVLLLLFVSLIFLCIPFGLFAGFMNWWISGLLVLSSFERAFVASVFKPFERKCPENSKFGKEGGKLEKHLLRSLYIPYLYQEIVTGCGSNPGTGQIAQGVVTIPQTAY